jgi:CRISPR-associated protein Csb2
MLTSSQTNKTGEWRSKSLDTPWRSIAGLCFQSAPFWAGAEDALAMRVLEHLGKWPRYHVAVRFSEPVTGPVLAGIGRHYGIGLFAAVPKRQE